VSNKEPEKAAVSAMIVYRSILKKGILTLCKY
jgi:hypothetical protein